jgi:hypothetical protein
MARLHRQDISCRVIKFKVENEDDSDTGEIGDSEIERQRCLGSATISVPAPDSYEYERGVSRIISKRAVGRQAHYWVSKCAMQRVLLGSMGNTLSSCIDDGC